MNPLLGSCLYTIAHPDKLAHWASLRGPSTHAVQQRMTAAADLHREAAAEGRSVAVLFGDATACASLIYWAILTAVDVGEADTHLTFSPPRPLPAGHSPQDLVLESTGKAIAPGFIRAYALCRTPNFITAAC